MAQAMASVAGLSSYSHTVMEGSLHISRLSGGRVAVSRSAFSTIRAQQQQQPAETETVKQSSRRAVLGLVAAGIASGSFVKTVLADVKTIKVGPPPPPSGGLPGTLNSDQPRDLDLPLKNRFYIQPLPPTEAAKRAKASAQDILNVKALIDKKQWPYVKNDLRLKASYLRYDLNTVIAAKSKEEKKAFKELTNTLFSKLDDLDHAAKIKSTSEAEKYYTEAKSVLGDVIAKLG